MDWRHYKARCDSPDVWSRWMLAQTMELAAGDPELVALMNGALAQQPLRKPPGHKGGAATDMFELHLDAAQADAMLALVRQAVERGAETGGTRGRGLGGFLQAWTDYRRFVAAAERLPGDGLPTGARTCSPKS